MATRKQTMSTKEPLQKRNRPLEAAAFLSDIVFQFSILLWFLTLLFKWDVASFGTWARLVLAVVAIIVVAKAERPMVSFRRKHPPSEEECKRYLFTNLVVFLVAVGQCFLP